MRLWLSNLSKTKKARLTNEEKANARSKFSFCFSFVLVFLREHNLFKFNTELKKIICVCVCVCVSMANPVQSQEVDPDTLRKHLAVAVRSVQWSYAIFWSLSKTQQGYDCLLFYSYMHSSDAKVSISGFWV